MTNSKFDYLRNMGVDVWTRRENVLDIATVKGFSDAPVESVAVDRSGTQAGPPALASPEPVSHATNQSEILKMRQVYQRCAR